jgi:alkanesulfonate monooxygenase SsuD/methylene tetrahydromethanopterin reductase-like flavin-dependent oxidoreductase (luciferase family)
MRFGVFVPPFAEFAEPRRVVALSTAAEASGWDGVFLWDHMLAFPGMAVADPWVVMAAMAAATQRIRLGALVTPLPRRRPWVLSRQMATLDQLSNGRLIGGIGLGDDGWTEFSSFGEAVEPVTRGEMLDEALELVQRFLTGEPVCIRRRCCPLPYNSRCRFGVRCGGRTANRWPGLRSCRGAFRSSTRRADCRHPNLRTLQRSGMH